MSYEENTATLTPPTHDGSNYLHDLLGIDPSYQRRMDAAILREHALKAKALLGTLPPPNSRNGTASKKNLTNWKPSSPPNFWRNPHATNGVIYYCPPQEDNSSRLSKFTKCCTRNNHAMIEFPDVNVLVALLDPAHIHHQTSWDWFTRAESTGWAT